MQTRFLRAQRLESIGTLASGIAHDLNNVLIPILMGLTVVRSEVKSPDNLAMPRTPPRRRNGSRPTGPKSSS